MEVSVRVDDPEGVDRSDPLEDSFHLSGLDWVDPRVTRFASVFLDEPSISFFIGKNTILKSDVSDGILAIEYCRPTDTICMGWSPSEGPFFFVYAFLFFDMHVTPTFDDFTMGVLQTLNVAPSELLPKHMGLPSSLSPYLRHVSPLPHSFQFFKLLHLPPDRSR